MNTDDFAEVRDLRPTPPPPSDQVVLRAKERLMNSIAQEEREQIETVATDPAPLPTEMTTPPTRTETTPAR